MNEKENRFSRDNFTAEERAALREIAGFVGPLREIVEDRKWRGTTWSKLSTTGAVVKAWAMWLTAFAGVVTIFGSAFKYLLAK